MKKSFLVLFLTLLLGTLGFSQTALPTSWDCNIANLPVGWTTNLTDYYNVGSVGYFHTAPSAKFNFTSCHTTIYFSDAPGTVSYYIRGASFTPGTFSVQESVNGTTWTDVHIWGTGGTLMPTNDLSAATAITDVLNSASRYVRFYYTLKTAGNVAIDDISITKAAATPAQEIAIRCGNTDIPTGTQYSIGNTSATIFKIINYGTVNVLNITSSNITGTDAGLFSISGLPASVPALDSATFTLNFAPTGPDGTKTATLSIGNNDSDENPFLIDIWAVKGSYATEPTDNATNLTFTNLKSYGFQVNFSNGATTPDGYVVMRKTGSAIIPGSEIPVDGNTYKRGQYIGGAQVAYIGSAGNFNPSFIVANTAYYFAVIPYNGYTGFENYLNASYLAGNTSTPADLIGTYYSGINPSASSFITDLHNLINPHTALYYGDYDDLMINTVLYRDTLIAGTSEKVVTCAYSGENYVYSDPWSWTYFSREHAFCQSWMPTYNDVNFSTYPEYADYHNLRPVNQVEVNAYRSNMPVGEVVNNTHPWYEGRYGTDTLGHTVYEPRDEVKGDVARSMLYMLVCYDGVNGHSWRLPTYLSVSFPYGQDVNVLLTWNDLDPVDNWEMAHNDKIQSVQDNRNPFVDHMDWVDLINFTTMTYAGIPEEATGDIQLTTYPNPSQGVLYVDFTGSRDENASLIITDLMGRMVFSQQISAKEGKNHIQVNTDLAPGTYALDVFVNNNNYNKKVMVY
jgi:endonuclease I